MTLDAQTIIYLVLIGITAGFVSGFIGIGGGIIIVPALIYLVGLSQLQAQGTSLALMLPPIGILAFMQYYKAVTLYFFFFCVPYKHCGYFFVTSILNYSCEIWGFSNAENIERVHRKFLKWLINLLKL